METAPESLVDRGHRAKPAGIMRLDFRDGPVTNFLGRAPGLHVDEQAKLPIKGKYRRGALLVDLQSHLNGFRPIVLALKQLAVTAIAPVCDFGRTLGDVVHRLAFLA